MTLRPLPATPAGCAAVLDIVVDANRELAERALVEAGVSEPLFSLCLWLGQEDDFVPMSLWPGR